MVSGGSSNLGNASSAVVLGDATHTGILSYTGNSATYTRGFTVNAGGGEVDVTTSGQLLTIGTGNIVDASGGTITIGGIGNTLIASTIGGGSGGLTKTGSGTLTLTGSNTYTGLTTVNNGEVDLNSSALAVPGNLTIGDGIGAAGSALVLQLAANQIVTTAAVQIDGADGELNLNNFNQTIASLADRTGGSGTNGILNLGTAILTVGDTTSTTYSSSITGTLGDGLIKNGSGTLTLAANGTNIALTNATVNSGKLNFSATTGTVTLNSLSGPGSTNFAAGANVGGTFSQGTATVAGVGTFNIVSGGTVNLNGSTSSITTLNGGTVNLGSGDTTTITNGTDTGSINGLGSLVKAGGSTDILT